jgi:hypothetical protein
MHTAGLLGLGVSDSQTQAVPRPGAKEDATVGAVDNS